ncbi:MAG: tRNA pseudouridine(55) synthase TruB [Bacilli bacterium]|nr:tRNA pseudouridine(55) synthase TruB [Bacilli bacterium]
MNGIIVVDKPKNYTSRDVVNIISKELHTKKVGHTGTLDPIATGVLVVCVGASTKLVELLTDSYKEYEAEITLGLLTDTLDTEGNIIKEESVSIKKEDIINALDSMVGKYIQEVPIYSAIKVNGKKLYEYAREGIDVELPKREVNIKNIELISDIEYGKFIKFRIRTLVSKGTYIRSLIRDIALKLNNIGIMSDLRRTKQGRFDIKDSYSIDDIRNGNYKLLTIDDALTDIYSVDIDDDLYKKISNGVKIPNTYGKDMILFKYNGSSIALYKNDNNVLRMYKLFN